MILKTQILLYLIVISFGLGISKANAGTGYTWTGSGSNSNWSNSNNWSPFGVPVAGDDVSVGTNANITVDGLSACSTFSVTDGNPTLTLSATLIISGAITASRLTINGPGTLTINGSLTNINTLTVNSGTIALGANAYISNPYSGNICNFSGATINMDITSYISNAYGATFTINGGSSVNFLNGASSQPSAGFYNIQNSGTFYAGTSASACTINLSTGYASVSNVGFFYLGSTSIINLTDVTANLDNSGTFTLQSDVNGSASIGTLSDVANIYPQCFGTYNVERYISAIRGYRELSSPVDTATVNSINVYSIHYLKKSCWLTGTTGTTGGFDKSGNPTLYLYREDRLPSNASFISGNFRGIYTINNSPSDDYTMDLDGGPFNIPVGNGYLLYFRGDKNQATLTAATTAGAPATSATLTATGTLNQGQITVHDWYTPASSNLGETTASRSIYIEGFNLVGNPYASSIDWDKYNTGTPGTGIYASGIGPFLYVLMPNGNYNVYQAGQGGTSVGNIANSNVIPSGQGFFVQATGPNPTLTFNESAKTTAQAVGPNLFMGTPPQAAVNQYLHLMFQKDSVNAGGILISFKSNANAAYVRGEDAPYKVGYGSASLSSMSSDRIPLAINTMPLPKTTAQVIPLNVSASVTGIYQINLTAIKSIPDLYDVWLMDTYKKDSLDIKHNPTYSFNINKSDASSYGSKRFTLVIRQNPALGVHLLNFAATKATVGAQIVWKTENEENYTNFTVERSTDGGVTYDVLDGLVSSAQGTYSFVDTAPLNNKANLYVLKLVDLNGTVTYSHVVTLMYGNLTNTIAGNIKVYPNPSNGVINLSVTSANSLTTFHPGTTSIPVTQNTSSISYAIKIIDITGSVIKTATSTSANWQADVTSLTPGTYIIQVLNNSDKSLVGKSTFIKL
ncbi:MAG: Cadherin-like beta sandwich domain protein [Mucilaginibacter sp.]|nr:Cadherin-like beta sandwich domain protein [Mucilaginibacter sp.]